MKLGKLLARLGLAAVLLSTLSLQLSTAHAQGTAFTYQGVLSQNGAAVNGSNDLTFTLYNAVSAGATVGTSNVVNDLVMTNGLFTVTLDFGTNAFNGSARWLQIAARPGASTGAYTNLAPRTPITATPYAIYAASAATAGSASSVAASNITGTIDDGHLFTNVARLNVGNTFSESQTFRTSTGGVVISSSTGGQFGSGTLRVQGNTGLGADPHPLYRLFVAGTLSAGSYVGDGSQLANVEAETYLGPVADNQLSANIARRTNGNTFSGNQIIANGNLGLGTATPNNLLDVAAGGVIGSSAVTGANGHDPLNRGTKVSFGYNILGSELNGMRAVVNPGTAGCGNSGDLLFYTWECNTSGSREVMRINGSGKVGIGTINPATTLDVQSANPEITVGTSDNTEGALYFGNPGHGVKRAYSAINDVGLYTTAGDVYLSANGTTTDHFVLKNDGNVGIGTGGAGIADKFHVLSPSSMRIRAETTDSGYAGFLSKNTLGEWFSGVAPSSSAWILAENSPTSGNRLVVQSGGNVGIGTSSPTAKLEVAGDTRVNGRLNVNRASAGNTTMQVKMLPGEDIAALFFDSAGGSLVAITDPAVSGGLTLTVQTGEAAKPGGGSWATLSDARAKKNVHNLDGALSRLLALRSVTYEYKDPAAPGAKAGTQNGFIAQEVEPLFPDWVTTDAKGIKMLSISGFESLTVAALRELQAEKDAQFKKIEAQNAKLQEQNQSLEQRVAALEKLINGLSVTKGDAQ